MARTATIPPVEAYLAGASTAKLPAQPANQPIHGGKGKERDGATLGRMTDITNGE
jgi:hypothetical protein